MGALNGYHFVTGRLLLYVLCNDCRSLHEAKEQTPTVWDPNIHRVSKKTVPVLFFE